MDIQRKNYNCKFSKANALGKRKSGVYSQKKNAIKSSRKKQENHFVQLMIITC